MAIFLDIIIYENVFKLIPFTYKGGVLKKESNLFGHLDKVDDWAQYLEVVSASDYSPKMRFTTPRDDPGMWSSESLANWNMSFAPALQVIFIRVKVDEFVGERMP